MPAAPMEMAAAAGGAAIAPADAVAAVTSASPMSAPTVAPLSAAAMESMKRRGLQLSEFVTAMARKDSPDVSIPLELKLLLGLMVLFLFLLFLIAVLWDRYGKEIGELYTPNVTSAVNGNGEASDANPNDVADEYTVYQKLPTFFYEYMPKKRN